MTAKEERHRIKNYLYNFDLTYLSNMKEKMQRENKSLDNIVWRNKCQIEIIDEILAEVKTNNKKYMKEDEKRIYKGKSIASKSWVFGYLSKEPDDYPTYIITDDTKIEVDPDSVGRAIGLTDTNGNLIYDNDILRINGDIGIIEYEDTNIMFVTLDKNLHTIKFDLVVLSMVLKNFIYIIDNTYDNENFKFKRLIENKNK